MKAVITSLALVFVFTTLLTPDRTDGASDETPPLAQSAEEPEWDESFEIWNKRFVTQKNGIVTDTKTGLEWFVGPDKDTTWDEARMWVESLAVDGGGWRMPTREEMKSLYRKGAGTGNMTPLLKTRGGYVWTGETVEPSYAWGFCFEIGDEYWPLRSFSDTARAFAVRNKRNSGE